MKYPKEELLDFIYDMVERKEKEETLRFIYEGLPTGE